jgi:hypothetical protein
MFHYFKIPFFTCTFFSKFIYNEYIGPCFLSHDVSKIFASDLPKVVSPLGWWINNSIFNHRKYLFIYSFTFKVVFTRRYESPLWFHYHNNNYIYWHFDLMSFYMLLSQGCMAKLGKWKVEICQTPYNPKLFIQIAITMS